MEADEEGVHSGSEMLPLEQRVVGFADDEDTPPPEELPPNPKFLDGCESYNLTEWRTFLHRHEVTKMSIHQLARDGDWSRLSEVLSRYGPTASESVRNKVNAQDEDGLTPLHYAARYNHYAVVRLLVANGADVNALGEDDVAPLHFAARYTRTDRSTRVAAQPVADRHGDSQKKRKRKHGNLRRSNSLDEGLQEEDERMTLAQRVRRKFTHQADEIPGAIAADGTGSTYLSDKPHFADDSRLSEHNALDFPNWPNDLETGSIISYLIKNGANPNAQDIYGQTPLHYAAMRGNVVVARELLKSAKSKVCVQTADKSGVLPLHAACAHGWADVVSLLLRYGADMEATDDQSNLPLHAAAEEGHMHIVKMLFAHGYAQNNIAISERMLHHRDYEGNTALHLAVENGHYNVVKYLIKQGKLIALKSRKSFREKRRGDVNTHRLLYSTPLHAAAARGNVAIVALLVQNGAKIEAINAEQQTPLHRAAAKNNTPAIEYLREHGANLEPKDNDGYTPLLLAAAEGHAEAVRMLVSLGADLSATEKRDRTAAHLSAEFNNKQVLDVVLNHSSRFGKELVSKPDRYGSTPLHLAAHHGFIEVLRLLLDCGARIDAKNEEEKTPLHLAAAKGWTRIARELVKRNKKIVADEDEDSNQALHIAATEGHEMVAQVLLDAGALVDARNAVLWTPLDCAASAGRENCVDLLLKNDAPVDPADKTKTTPLHLAARNGHSGCVKLLLSRNASVSILDWRGWNCLDNAVEEGHREAAIAIIQHQTWKDALRNSHWNDAGMLDTPLRKLIRKLPDVAETVFDSVTFDYEFLDDAYFYTRETELPGEVVQMAHRPSKATLEDTLHESNERCPFDESGRLKPEAHRYTSNEDVIKNNHCMQIMVDSEREHLLSHPLVISLLRRKWNNFGRYVYYGALFVYLIFIAVLTAFVLYTPPPYAAPTNVFVNNTTELRPANLKVLANGTCPSVPLHRTWFSRFSKYAIIALALIQIVKELYQAMQRRLGYLSFENAIEWFVYVTVIIFMWDYNDCSSRTGVRLDWQWQIGAVCTFLAWINLVLMIRKFPLFGIYVVMFTDILKTFSSFFIVFMLFVTSFALTFFMLMMNVKTDEYKRPVFSSLPESIVKTTVMMIGEFEHDPIFHEMNLPYRNVSLFVFWIFLLIITILIMNLLVGLAVDDIKGVQGKAVLTRLAMTVELVLHVEQALPEKFRRRHTIGKATIQPNAMRASTIFDVRKLIWAEPTKLSTENIVEQIKTKAFDISSPSRLRQQQDLMQSELTQLRQRVTSLQNEQARTQSMLMALLTAQKVKWEDQDEFGDV